MPRSARPEDDSLPEQWNRDFVTETPPGTTWAKELYNVHEAARVSAHFEGRFLTGFGNNNPACRIRPGSVILVCTRRGKLRVYVFLPGGIWFRTNQADVEHQDGWPRILRQHCRGWLAMDAAQRILRACNEAIFDLNAGLEAAGDDLADSRTFREALVDYERIASEVTGEVTQLTHAGILASLNAWIDDIAASTEANRDVVMTVLAESMEQEARLESDIRVADDPLTVDDPLDERLAATYRVMVRLNMTPGDVQRLFDLMDRTNDLTAASVEAAERIRTGQAFGPEAAATEARGALEAARQRQRVARRGQTPESADTSVPGAFNRLARNIRIRSRRSQNDGD